ncbi:hypothetical protein IW148_005255 [Coemansia sp. RSA 1199]|nr:hypothetical protein IW148_005255 [Coemansia sp. RSA 1199]
MDTAANPIPHLDKRSAVGGFGLDNVGGIGGFGGAGFNGFGFNGAGFNGAGVGASALGGWGVGGSGLGSGFGFFPFASSFTNQFDANNNFAHFNDDTLYINDKDATVANNNVHSFNNANVIA